MKKVIHPRAAYVAFLVGTLSLGLLSWDFKQQPGSIHIDQKTGEDTIPSNREKKVRDLDDVLKELDEAQFNINKDLRIDMEKMKKEMNEAFRNFDMDKIKLDIEKSLKDIDLDKLKLEIEGSIAKIDWDKMKMELEKVKEIDLSKLEKEMKNLEIEMRKIGPQIEESLAKAKVEIEKARKEMKEYNSFIDQLEKDGLLKRSAGYTLRHKDGEFFINGKKQSAEVYNKYRSFLEKHKTFNIEKTDDDLDIDLD